LQHIVLVSSVTFSPCLWPAGRARLDFESTALQEEVRQQLVDAFVEMDEAYLDGKRDEFRRFRDMQRCARPWRRCRPLSLTLRRAQW
jgi:hypothetical protein